MTPPALPPAPRDRPHGMIALAGLGLIGVLMMSARAMVPTQVPHNPNLVPILVGGIGNRDLVQRVRSPQHGLQGSVIHATRLTERGVIVEVTAPGPRVVVLLDSDGAATVTQVEGHTVVNLALPRPDSRAPYVVTVVSSRGSGGVLDAQAVTVAALTD